MAVKIRKGKTTAKGKSLYLDIYFKGKRRYEFLNLYLRKDNKEDVMQKANAVKEKFEKDIFNQHYGLIEDKSGEDFTGYYLKYKHLEHFRVFRACRNHLMKYAGSDIIPAKEITEDFCRGFKKYLEKNLTGESPYGYYKSFKRMLKDATRDGYFFKNPSEHIVNKNPTGRDIKKDVLYEDEIRLLYKGHCGSLSVRRAFLLALQTGLRLVDIRLLNWTNIDFTKNVLKFSQSKTSRQNIVPLSEEAVSILKSIEHTRELIFSLPSTNAVNKSIKNWVDDANKDLPEEERIKKHVTFHVARHSAITQWLSLSGNLKLAGSLAGHASIRETEKYSHIADQQKIDVISKMPKMK